MTQFIIEDIEPPDVPELVSIGDECGLSHWSSDDYLSEFSRSDSIILRALDNRSEIIGFIVGRVVLAADTDEAVDAEIYNVGVRKPFQHKGCGKLLLHQFLSRCKRQAVRRVWLEVRASNFQGIGFYLNTGFAENGRRKAFYSGPGEDAITMSLALDDFIEKSDKKA
jgi:ribosomal-protein-alanine N-acetyltransferase